MASLHSYITCIILKKLDNQVIISLPFYKTILFIAISFMFNDIFLQHIVTRLGRWIDFENDYKTMYPWFMETIWWVFKELFNNGLVYRGSKVRS